METPSGLTRPGRAVKLHLRLRGTCSRYKYKELATDASRFEEEAGRLLIARSFCQKRGTLDSVELKGL